MKKTEVVVPAPGPSITLTPFPEAQQALSLTQSFGGLAVVDQATHQQCLEGLSAAKLMKRKIIDHWRQIKQAVDTLKRSVLTMEATDLQPVERVIAHLDQVSVAWINEAN